MYAGIVAIQLLFYGKDCVAAFIKMHGVAYTNYYIGGRCRCSWHCYDKHQLCLCSHKRV